MRTKDRMNERHYQALEYIKQYSKANGFPPSIREIGIAIGVKSTSLVNFYLSRLEAEGLITRAENRARTIVVVQ